MPARLPRRQKSIIAIDVGREILAAVRLRIAGGTVRVERSLVRDIPADIDTSDAEWLGKWIGRTLDEAGFGKGPVAFVLPRHLVGLKRLTLPTRDADELPGMVRLEMAGNLPFADEEAVLDYAVLGSAEGRTDVVAAAVRGVVVERYRGMAEAMKRSLARISLRPLATAALVSDRGVEVSGGVLAVDLREHGHIEVSVEWNGRFRFARGTELAEVRRQPDLEHHELARLLATEAKRSWLSHRAADEEAEVERAVVIGPDGIAGGVAEAVRRDLGVPTEVLLSRQDVKGDLEDLGSAWPLVGVGIEALEHRDVIDFAAPKQPPDLGARLRVRILGAAAALVIAALVVGQVAVDDLRGLEARAAELRERRNDLGPRYARTIREQRRLEHLERWDETRIDWLDHLAYLSDRMPSAEEAVLGTLVGNLADADIPFDTRGAEWEPTRLAASLRFSGVARTRGIADAIRLRFVEDPLYRTEPVGSDAGTRDERYTEAFAMLLRTNVATPYPERSVAAGDEEAGTRSGAPTTSTPTAAPGTAESTEEEAEG